MSREEQHNIIVAETSPIIAAGFASCLQRMPGIHVHPLEVSEPSELAETVRRQNPKLVIVNPSFGGAFVPEHLRISCPGCDFKVVAIEVAPLDRHVRSLYDETVSVVDDLDTLSAKLSPMCRETEPRCDEKDVLSQREKEILVEVVKGLTNKEIADRLYLSVHTVITHRRNIARKLEIHSATGLTIYAIVNRLVDLADLHL